MKRKTVAGLFGIVVSILAIGIWRSWPTQAPNSENVADARDVSIGESRMKPVSEVATHSPVSVPHQQSLVGAEGRAVAPDGRAGITEGPSAHLNLNPRDSRRALASTGAEGLGKNVGSDESIDDTKVGEAFPLSQSIREACRRAPFAGPYGCTEIYDLLAQLAQQPRVGPWAEVAERDVRALAGNQATGPFNIRTLECRATLCAIEVDSTAGVFPGTIGDGDHANQTLLSWFSTWGYEGIDPSSGIRVTVTLKFYKRR